MTVDCDLTCTKRFYMAMLADVHSYPGLISRRRVLHLVRALLPLPPGLLSQDNIKDTALGRLHYLGSSVSGIFVPRLYPRSSLFGQIR